MEESSCSYLQNTIINIYVLRVKSESSNRSKSKVGGVSSHEQAHQGFTSDPGQKEDTPLLQHLYERAL